MICAFGFRAHRNDTHLIAIFFTEQRPGTGLAGLIQRHYARNDFSIRLNLFIHNRFDLLQFLSRNRFRVRDIETRAPLILQRTFLRDMIA